MKASVAATRTRALAALSLCAGALIAPGAARAGDVRIAAGPGELRVQVQSIAERRFSRAVRQRYDTSCGSAAVASLLAFHYAHPVGEEEIFWKMWERGDQERIRRVGFSLLDLREYLVGEGFAADGYAVSLSQLAEVGLPAIALIDPGYRHFVVVQGVSESEVLVADPALGVRIVGRERFEAIRDPILLVVRTPLPPEDGRLRSQFRIHPAAPLGAARRESPLEGALLSLPALNEF